MFFLRSGIMFVRVSVLFWCAIQTFCQHVSFWFILHALVGLFYVEMFSCPMCFLFSSLLPLFLPSYKFLLAVCSFGILGFILVSGMINLGQI